MLANEIVENIEAALESFREIADIVNGNGKQYTLVRKYSNHTITKDDNMNRYKFSVIIEKDEDGYYAFVPELKGCYTHGNSYEEVYERIQDAIRLCVEDQIACGEPVHQFEHVSLTMVEMAV